MKLRFRLPFSRAHQVATSRQQYLPTRKAPASNLLIFVHGFTGDYRQTWGDLPLLLRADERFENFDFFLFGYLSPRWGRAADLLNIGLNLMTLVRLEFNRKYDRLFFLCHSMGGLILKQGLARFLLDGQAHHLRKIEKVVFASTPHEGAVQASLLQKFGSHLRYLRALAPETLEANRIWRERVVTSLDEDIAHENYSARLQLVNFWGINDNIVSRANAFALRGEEIVLPGDHSSVVRPSSIDDESYVRLAQTLLEEPQPGRQAPSERVMFASQGLSNGDLLIRVTKEIPDKYELLCQELIQALGPP
jgi:pimeloyl-ACP methyl ester carboxylesterase